MTISSLSAPATPAPIWPRWIYDTILGILFLGPLISPLFRATELPLLTESGMLARDVLATYICPTPERSYMLLGLPMAVCARCWGATIGLLVARGALTRFGHLPFFQWFGNLPWALRLVIAGLPFLLWPLEIITHYQGSWHAPMSILLLNGAQAGFAAGVFFSSLWPGMWPKPRQ